MSNDRRVTNLPSGCARSEPAVHSILKMLRAWASFFKSEIPASNQPPTPPTPPKVRAARAKLLALRSFLGTPCLLCLLTATMLEDLICMLPTHHPPPRSSPFARAGIKFEIRNGSEFTIVSVDGGSPAEESGLLPGDIILRAGSLSRVHCPSTIQVGRFHL